MHPSSLIHQNNQNSDCLILLLNFSIMISRNWKKTTIFDIDFSVVEFLKLTHVPIISIGHTNAFFMNMMP
jgi:hypothetical protein